MMTIEETRDQLAKLCGWKQIVDTSTGKTLILWVGSPGIPFFTEGYCDASKNPIPLSLDAITTLWPSEWTWQRHFHDWYAYDDDGYSIEISDTSNELFDRMTLTMLVLEELIRRKKE